MASPRSLSIAVSEATIRRGAGVFVSTKTYGDERGFSVAYRQWRAESHCRHIHGYTLRFHIEIEGDELDARNWLADFGSFKSLKDQFEDWFDHTFLVAEDDPEFKRFEEMHKDDLIKMVVVERTGCEGLAKWLFDYIDQIWLPENGYAPRCRVRNVEVRETCSNSAWYERDR
jgi:6-pyruvoyltetrahydropterin/6-carboxytetrahydropterin synthase